MPTKYLILRADQPVDDLFFLRECRGPWTPTRGARPTSLTIDTLDGHETDAGALRANPRNVAVMDAGVVLSLIEPKSVAPGNSATLSLVGAVRMPDGIKAVGAHTAPFTGQGVTVAILDTGIDAAIPPFRARRSFRRTAPGGVRAKQTSPTTKRTAHIARRQSRRTRRRCPGRGRAGVVKALRRQGVGRRRWNSRSAAERPALGSSRAEGDSGVDVAWLRSGSKYRTVDGGWRGSGLSATQAILREQSDIIKGISTLRAYLEIAVAKRDVRGRDRQ